MFLSRTQNPFLLSALRAFYCIPFPRLFSVAPSCIIVSIFGGFFFFGIARKKKEEEEEEDLGHPSSLLQMAERRRSRRKGEKGKSDALTT